MHGCTYTRTHTNNFSPLYLKAEASDNKVVTVDEEKPLGKHIHCFKKEEKRRGEHIAD